ncbi:MAG TPA: LptF/LptG family permease [Longimicrobiales bacterium]|nr:LptF/LptG family permease [Longimicrobiales bacterium]
MRILDRYVAREFIKLFLLFSICAPILFILGDWTDNLDTYSDRGLGNVRVGLGYLYRMPEFISWSFPIAALIATVFTVSNMTRHSEMAAAKAGGVSFYSALRTLPLLGALLTVVGLGLVELVPIAERARKEVMGEARGNAYTRTEFVYNGDRGDVYAIQRLDAELGRMSGVLLQREGDGRQHPDVHVMADGGLYDDSTGIWLLNDGYYRVLLADSSERAIRFGALHTPGFDPTPEQLTARAREPEEMGFFELGRFIDVLERSGARPLKLMVERLQKIAIPAATLIIILFGAPLANSSARGGPAYGIGISLGITIVYLMLFKVTEAAGATGALPVVWAAWLPNAVFAVAAVLLMARIRT